MSIVGAFIVPHPPLAVPQVGRGQEEAIQNTIRAYQEVAQRIAALQPETIIITSPHSVMYSDYFHISPGEAARGSFSSFGAPEIALSVKYDTGFVRSLCETAKEENIRAGTQGEYDKKLDHGTMVPLYFINQVYTDYRLVRIGLSGFSPVIHYHFGKCIARVAEKVKRRVVFVASGDLSHKLTREGPYGYAEEGPAFDRRVTAAMSGGDFLEFLKFDENFCEAAAECGLRSFLIMAGALDKVAVKPALLSYEGPYGVGYAVAAYTVEGEDEARRFDQIYEDAEHTRVEKLKQSEGVYVRLTRQTLEQYIRYGKRIERPGGLPEEMLKKKAGVFVSLKLEGRLRGCIGTIAPTMQNIAEEIIQNAISAGTQDPRFEEVREEELGRLVYSVDVLEKPEPIESLDELEVQQYGVIVSSGTRRGLLLPNLEGVDTPEQQVNIALQKAGIRPDERYQMERFRVVRHT